MRITPKNIKFVKEHNGIHNPESVFTVMVGEGRKRELKEYNLYNLPKVVKRWLKDREYETWYEGTELVTYMWRKEQ